MEPYNPNKSFIQFRLNPDAIKEELISFVPYNRTLRHIYNNPEGDIRETAKVALSETPVIGSLLAGEPTDAVKEAVLVGFPIGTPVNGRRTRVYDSQRKFVNDNPNKRFVDINGQLYLKEANGDIISQYYHKARPIGKQIPIGNNNKALKYIDDSETYMNSHPNVYQEIIEDLGYRDELPISKDYRKLIKMKIDGVPYNELKEAEELFNIKYGLDDNYVPLKDVRTWTDDVQNTANSYQRELDKDFYENVNPKKPWK